MKRRDFLAGVTSAPFLAAPYRARATTLPDLLQDAGQLEQLRAVAIWRGGEEIAAQGFHGFGPDDPTNIKSASKSIISALAGMAIGRGLLEGVDQPIAPILRDQLPPDPDPRLDQVTLGHLLSMQAGLERQSGTNYGRWVSSGNWVQAALAAPFTQDPGGGMQYSTASTHLISAILTRVSRRPTLSLARDWLGPVPGFAINGWDQDPQGIYLGGNQMSMSTRSLLAFGALYAADGRAGGRQILRPEWIEASWQPRTRSVFTGQGYGYGWFLARLERRQIRFGWGYGGQMIYVAPASGNDPAVAIAITSDPDQPSARTGYRDQLHDLARQILRQV
ncbi:serine hydrolase domain-containing protein [Paracoccus homiensis]|uniref:serine hydrolase domain-containing protein n=1 Tax=Paracoccus homiensis TaxID=364199 RepID=UPI00398D05C0